MVTAPITDADRLAALLALAYATPPVSERVIADVAQAIADARETERNACVAWVREAEGDGVADDLAAVRRSR